MDKEKYKSLFDIPAISIDGTVYESLGDLLKNKKCIMVVNVASKWGYTKKHYT